MKSEAEEWVKTKFSEQETLQRDVPSATLIPTKQMVDSRETAVINTNLVSDDTVNDAEISNALTSASNTEIADGKEHKSLEEEPIKPNVKKVLLETPLMPLTEEKEFKNATIITENVEHNFKNITTQQLTSVQTINSGNSSVADPVVSAAGAQSSQESCNVIMSHGDLSDPREDYEDEREERTNIKITSERIVIEDLNSEQSSPGRGSLFTKQKLWIHIFFFRKTSWRPFYSLPEAQWCPSVAWSSFA